MISYQSRILYFSNILLAENVFLEVAFSIFHMKCSWNSCSVNTFIIYSFPYVLTQIPFVFYHRHIFTQTPYSIYARYLGFVSVHTTLIKHIKRTYQCAKLARKCLIEWYPLSPSTTDLELPPQSEHFRLTVLYFCGVRDLTCNAIYQIWCYTSPLCASSDEGNRTTTHKKWGIKNICTVSDLKMREVDVL